MATHAKVKAVHFMPLMSCKSISHFVYSISCHSLSEKYVSHAVQVNPSHSPRPHFESVSVEDKTNNQGKLYSKFIKAQIHLGDMQACRCYGLLVALPCWGWTFQSL